MKYWNPYLETLDRQELNQIELSYFRNILSFAKEHSILYRDKLIGIDPDGIKTLEDVKHLPLTDKEELRNKTIPGLFLERVKKLLMK